MPLNVIMDFYLAISRVFSCPFGRQRDILSLTSSIIWRGLIVTSSLIVVAATFYGSEDIIALVSTDTVLINIWLSFGWFRSVSATAIPSSFATKLIARNHGAILVLLSWVCVGCARTSPFRLLFRTRVSVLRYSGIIVLFGLSFCFVGLFTSSFFLFVVTLMSHNLLRW